MEIDAVSGLDASISFESDQEEDIAVFINVISNNLPSLQVLSCLWQTFYELQVHLHLLLTLADGFRL